MNLQNFLCFRATYVAHQLTGARPQWDIEAKAINKKKFFFYHLYAKKFFKCFVLLIFCVSLHRYHFCGVLAHLARALDWQSKGGEFESRMLHLSFNEKVKRVCQNSQRLKITLAADRCSEGDFIKTNNYVNL